MRFLIVITPKSSLESQHAMPLFRAIGARLMDIFDLYISRSPS